MYFHSWTLSNNLNGTTVYTGFSLNTFMSKKIQDNFAEVSQANQNFPTDMHNWKDIFWDAKKKNVMIILANDRRLHECPKCPHWYPQMCSLLWFTWTLFFSSHTYSTSDSSLPCYDSHDTQTLFLSFTHLLHPDSYLCCLWLIVLTLTPLWLISPYCTFTIYTARYPPVTLAWSYSNIPEF